MRTFNPDENWQDGNVDKTLLELAGIKTEHSERGDMQLEYYDSIILHRFQNSYWLTDIIDVEKLHY